MQDIRTEMTAFRWAFTWSYSRETTNFSRQTTNVICSPVCLKNSVKTCFKVSARTIWYLEEKTYQILCEKLSQQHKICNLQFETNSAFDLSASGINWNIFFCREFTIIHKQKVSTHKWRRGTDKKLKRNRIFISYHESCI